MFNLTFERLYLHVIYIVWRRYKHWVARGVQFSSTRSIIVPFDIISTRYVIHCRNNHVIVFQNVRYNNNYMWLNGILIKTLFSITCHFVQEFNEIWYSASNFITQNFIDLLYKWWNDGKYLILLFCGLI